MEKLLTPKQLAEALQVSLSTIYHWISSEYIVHHKLGGTVRFKESEVLRWLEKRKCRGRSTKIVQFEQHIEENNA
ncbi:MAG: helix-turn-helix domain-containing protein [Deltaproteobacteria bacterium]|nr:helix-turn-helix domain-containing protein [Deltaproteobacteria bacterium]